MAKMQIDIIGKDKTQKAFNSLQNNVSKTQKSFFTLKNAIIGIVGSVVIKQVLDLTNEFQQLQNRLKLVTNSTKELNTVQAELFDISKRTRGGFSETVELYQKLALQAGSLGLEQKELLQITENVNKVIGIAGVGSVQASAGILQLSQAFASGRLQGDEFRSISENIPPLLNIFAKELGVTRGELKKLGSEGKITSEVIATALLKETENITEAYSQLSPTIGQANTVLRNSFVDLIGTFAQTTGASDLLAESLIGLSKFINKLSESLKPVPNNVEAITERIMELREQMDIMQDPEGLFHYRREEEEIAKLQDRLKDLQTMVQRVGGGADLAETETLDELYNTAEKLKEEQKAREEIQEKIIGQCKVEDSLQQQILDKIIEQNAQFNLASEIFSLMTDTISSLSRGIARSIVLGEDMAETFKMIARNLLIEIIAKTIERLALLALEKLIIEKIFGKQKSQVTVEKEITREKQNHVGLQALLMAMGGGGGGKSFGSIFHARASGGSVQKGQPYMVGEKGAELFIPNQSGQITQSARGTGNGGATTVNFNINTLDASGFEDLLVRSRGTITSIINNAVNERGERSLI